jgi:hypothetical protein
MNRHEFIRIYNNFYLFLELVVSPTAVGEEKGRDGGGILGASREAAGSRGETTAGSWVRRGRQWGARERRAVDDAWEKH